MVTKVEFEKSMVEKECLALNDVYGQFGQTTFNFIFALRTGLLF